MKIKLSKRQWELIGRKAQWIKSAQITYPTRQNIRPKKVQEPQIGQELKMMPGQEPYIDKEVKQLNSLVGDAAKANVDDFEERDLISEQQKLNSIPTLNKMDIEVKKYSERTWAVYVNNELLCVTVYLKGANAVKNMLEKLWNMRK
jgi:hypothetical protein